MDLAQVSELKNKVVEELREIEALRKSMEHTLAGLVEWERQLQASAHSPVKTKRLTTVSEVEPTPQTPARPVVVSPIDRVSKALKRIQGEFTRSQLLAETESDGKGEMSAGAYSSIFSRLLQNHRVECVRGNPSERDSLYVRSNEKKSRQVPLI